MLEEQGLFWTIVGCVAAYLCIGGLLCYVHQALSERYLEHTLLECYLKAVDEDKDRNDTVFKQPFYDIMLVYVIGWPVLFVGGTFYVLWLWLQDLGGSDADDE